MLSPLQERIARIIAGLSEAEDFALAGGGALISRGDVNRKTRDLDFFGLSAAAVDRLVPVAELALREAGSRGCSKGPVLHALSSRTATIGPSKHPPLVRARKCPPNRRIGAPPARLDADVAPGLGE